MFNLKFKPEPIREKLSLDQRILLIGSCFSENMGEKLARYKMDVQVNPHGTIYNPASISHLMNRAFETEPSYRMVSRGGIFSDLDSHSKLSATDQKTFQNNLHAADQQLKKYLETADWLVVTPGTAWVYSYESDPNPVANCHKLPASHFHKHLLTVNRMVDQFEEVIQRVKEINPKANWLFTVSPVRHIRDGLVENNRSKAALLSFVHDLVEKHDHCHYFPSYEIMIDELRDYRFYDTDMVHPSSQATDYIWEKLVTGWMDKPAQDFVQQWEKILSAMTHRPFHPEGAEHQRFLQELLETLNQMKNRVNVDAEIKEVQTRIKK